ALKWSAAQIAKVCFADERVRHTPYMRGALYFADLDAKILQKSRGKRDLDAFLRPMFASRQKGERFDVPKWESMLREELGATAVTDFRKAMLEGTATLVPASGAFGPCFKREAVKMQGAEGEIQGYQWKRESKVPEARCRYWGAARSTAASDGSQL